VSIGLAFESLTEVGVRNGDECIARSATDLPLRFTIPYSDWLSRADK
jgi:hypothetical protein